MTATQPPTTCPNGHPLNEDTVDLTRPMCLILCPGVRAAGATDHYAVRCITCFLSDFDVIWYDPPHTPAPGDDRVTTQGAWVITDWRPDAARDPRVAPGRPAPVARGGG